jgi:heterodisulfide reductase subunit D
VEKIEGVKDESFRKRLLGASEGENLLGCLQCGTCTGSCPNKFAWGLTPRHIIRLIQLGMKEKILNPEVLYYCTQCYSCIERCPMKLKPTEIMMLLRRVAFEMKLPLMEPHLTFMTSLEDYDNPYAQPRNRRDRWVKKLNINIKNLSKERAKVFYYPGCTAAYNQRFNKVAMATATILSQAGVVFGILGNNERCCGSTALRIGNRSLYEKLAFDNIETFNHLGIDTLITACAGCYGVIKKEYPKILPLEFEVLHVSEYIEQLINQGKFDFHPVELEVTYHDPCHLGRHGGIYDPPRRVLESIPGVKLMEMKRIRNNSRCCGAGGGVKSGHADLALSMAQERLEEAMLTGAKNLVSCCPFCEANIGDALAEEPEISVYDLTEVVVKSLFDTGPRDIS